MSDLISRDAAIKAIGERDPNSGVDAVTVLNKLPSVNTESQGIGYRECADAMMKMWMDNVLTDAEYYRIMDRLNRQEKRRRGETE